MSTFENSQSGSWENNANESRRESSGRGRGQGDLQNYNNSGPRYDHNQTYYNRPYHRNPRHDNRGKHYESRRPHDKNHEDHQRESSPDRLERSRPGDKEHEDHRRDPSPDRSNTNDVDMENNTQTDSPGAYPKKSYNSNNKSANDDRHYEGQYDRQSNKSSESGHGSFERSKYETGNKYDTRPFEDQNYRPESRGRGRGFGSPNNETWNQGGRGRNYRNPNNETWNPADKKQYDSQYNQNFRPGSGYNHYGDSNHETWNQRGDRRSNYRGEKSDIQLSKNLSFLLRHGAEKQGYTLMPGGFLYVDDILKKQRNLQDYTLEDVEQVVKSNDKQRFYMEKEESTGRLKIRANQGHTLQVDDLDLKPITSKDETEMVVHGTYMDSWFKIKETGLCRMGRNHIHFAAGEPGENGVISGMRSSCEVMIYIDLEKALADGFKFFRSANNVILCAGNENGIIPPSYFKKVVQRYPRQRLDFNNQLSKPTLPVGATFADEKQKKKKKKKSKKEKDDETTPKKEKHEIDEEAEDDTGVLFQDESMDVDNSGVTEKEIDTKEKTSPPDNWDDSQEMNTQKTRPSEHLDDSQDKEEFHDAEDRPDVVIESKEDIITLDDVDYSTSAIDDCLKKQEVVAVHIEMKDDVISRLICATDSQTYIFDLRKNPDLMTEGGLADFFRAQGKPVKVFNGINSAVGAMLFNEYEIILDGTSIFDLKIAYRAMEDKGLGNVTELKQTGYDPESRSEFLNDSDINSQLQRNIQGYKYLVRLMERDYKRELFEMINAEIDMEEMKRVKAERKKKESKPKSSPEQPQLSQNKKKSKNKKK